MPIDYKIIGKRIQEQRKISKLTQEELAEQLDISASYQSRLERGATKISLETLVRIAEHLNISPGLLITGAVNTEVSYLCSDLNDIIKTASPDKIKLIYEVAAVIARNQADDIL